MRRFALLATLLPSLALAGERPFLWAYDTTIVPPGSVELEQWLWIRGSEPPNVPAGYWLWWSPVVGINRHIEAAVPFQILAVGGGATQLASFDPDIRWRLFAQDDRDGFQALVRTAYHQTPAGPSRVDLNLSASHGGWSDPRFLLEVGALIPAVRDPTKPAPPNELTYDLGFSYPFLAGELRLSTELFGVLAFDEDPKPTLAASGALAWVHGRFWVTLGLLVGITPPNEYTARFTPRLIWAVEL